MAKRKATKPKRKPVRRTGSTFQAVMWRGGVNFETYRCPPKVLPTLKGLIERKNHDEAYITLNEDCSFIKTIADEDDEVAEVSMVTKTKQSSRTKRKRR